VYTLYGTGLVSWSCIWSKKTDLKCLNDVAHVITFHAVNTIIKSVQLVYFKWYNPFTGKLSYLWSPYVFLVYRFYRVVAKS